MPNNLSSLNRKNSSISFTQFASPPPQKQTKKQSNKHAKSIIKRISEHKVHPLKTHQFEEKKTRETSVPEENKQTNKKTPHTKSASSTPKKQKETRFENKASDKKKKKCQTV